MTITTDAALTAVSLLIFTIQRYKREKIKQFPQWKDDFPFRRSRGSWSEKETASLLASRRKKATAEGTVPRLSSESSSSMKKLMFLNFEISHIFFLLKRQYHRIFLFNKIERNSWKTLKLIVTVLEHFLFFSALILYLLYKLSAYLQRKGKYFGWRGTTGLASW